ncbi:MAG: AAA family ATPase, partial [Planctomycetaceae bacterium]|nr:AAA family ATPase [Planctomycetaceae bacterium]
NCITSNPTLNRLSSQSQKDIHGVIRIAERDDIEGVDLEGNYSSDELTDMVSVMKKLLRVRDVILTVNREYIASAAQADEYRTEPPFKLQGSYRNMNRIAEKVLPVMNDEELETLILANYENDSQTLTSDTEANMLKFKELTGIISDEDAERWDSIRNTYQRNNRLKSVGGDDKFGQVILQLDMFAEQLKRIADSVAEGTDRLAEPAVPVPEPLKLEDAELNVTINNLTEQFGTLKEDLQEVGEHLIAQLPPPLQLEVPNLHEPAAPAQQPAEPVFDDQPVAIPETPIVQETQADDGSVVTLGSDRITVVNRIPKAMANVIRRQFELMHKWLEPIFAASQANQAELRELKKSLEECMKTYARTLDRIEKKRKR